MPSTPSRRSAGSPCPDRVRATWASRRLRACPAPCASSVRRMRSLPSTEHLRLGVAVPTCRRSLTGSRRSRRPSLDRRRCRASRSWRNPRREPPARTRAQPHSQIRRLISCNLRVKPSYSDVVSERREIRLLSRGHGAGDAAASGQRTSDARARDMRCCDSARRTPRPTAPPSRARPRSAPSRMRRGALASACPPARYDRARTTTRARAVARVRARARSTRRMAVIPLARRRRSVHRSLSRRVPCCASARLAAR